MQLSTPNPADDRNEFASTTNTGGTENQSPREKEAPKSRRGFASMDPERRRQVASSGGRIAHQQGVAHKWSREEASAAGKKGQQLRRSKEQ